ncbi:MAG: hypothetical protein ACREQJ_09390 [Candidatus Binatia bacterium]
METILGLFVVATIFLQACTSSAQVKRYVAQRPPATRPLELQPLAVLPVDVAVTGVEPVSAAALENALARGLESRLRSARARPSWRSTAEGQSGVARIHRALAGSPVHVYRELVGVPSRKPRHRLVPADVQAVAQAVGAETLLVARLQGSHTSASTSVAESATAVVGAAVLGAVTLSPTRVLTAATKVGETSRLSELRVALVHGASGEILWANWVRIRQPPSTQLVGALLEEALATFPPSVPDYASADR